MNKAERHRLKMKKFRKRLNFFKALRYPPETDEWNTHWMRTTGTPKSGLNYYKKYKRKRQSKDVWMQQMRE